jgi:hypothetical protein
LIFNKTLRYSETYLEAGDQVYVFGQASQADDGRWVMRHGEMPLIVSERGEHHVEKKVEKKAKWDSQLSGPIGAAVLAVVTLVVWVVGRP